MDFQTFLFWLLTNCAAQQYILDIIKKPAVRQEYKGSQYINNSYREVKKL